MQGTATATETRYVTASLRHPVTGVSTLADLPYDMPIDELERAVVRALELSPLDLEGRPAHYELFRRTPDGTGDKLPASGTVGDLVSEGDEISPQPQITPG
jgi:hypothetical protein